MIRKLNALFLCLAFIGLGGLRAQEAKTCFQEAKTCFKNMPDSICPLLTAVNRADFIDFLESKMKAEVTNRFGGKSEMTELSSSYIRVKMSAQSDWQMKLLPLDKFGWVICTVSTACAPACDSHVKFYTTDWEELPASSYLPELPAKEDFIAAASDTADVYAYQAAYREADMLLLKADLSAEEATLAFTFATPDYMSKEAAEKLKPFVRRPVVYTWSGRKFLKPSSTSL